MKVYVVIEPGLEYSFDEFEIKVFSNKEKVYKYLLKKIEKLDIDSELIESANLYFGKGDFDALIDIYEEATDVSLIILEKNIIK